MIYAYGVTQQGTYHVKKNIVCQDAHRIVKCSDSCVIAAVADGLGSEEHSDIASKLAVEMSADYCAEQLGSVRTDDQILELICDSFTLAQQRIEKTAEHNGHELDQYDTTLSLAILKGDVLYYGHSGDSGIVALTVSGLYQKVTEQQRDEEGRVFPLYFGDEKWVFAKYSEPVASVFLATDGMLETLFPIYLRNEPVSIYVALARYFMDAEVLRIAEIGEEAVQEKIGAFIDSIPDAQVNDDKTVAVLVNPDVEVTPQTPEYYAEPDWVELKRRHDEAWRRAAYPHLFKDEISSDSAVSANEEQVSETSSGEGVPEEGTTVQSIKKKGLFRRLMRDKTEQSGGQGESS